LVSLRSSKRKPSRTNSLVNEQKKIYGKLAFILKESGARSNGENIYLALITNFLFLLTPL
jgi:hypothetical protein